MKLILMEKSYATWSGLSTIDPSILSVLTETLAFSKVTRVQAAVIPLFLGNKDVCVKASTGSGKTLTFVVPLIQTLLKVLASGETTFDKHEVAALLIAPSRELVQQITAVLKDFAPLLPSLSFVYLIGGDKIEYDLERIRERGANVVVATPGRLFDLAIERHELSFRKLEMLIMDEADKLLL